MSGIRILFAGLATTAVLAGQAGATSEMQRCVWSCLHGAGNGNASSPAYNRCVDQRCAHIGEGGGAAQNQGTQKPDARLAWISGRTQSGMRYAGVDGRRPNTGLYYFCGRGQSFLRVIGIDGGERGMIIDVDGKQFPLSFQPNSRNQPESRLPGNSPVIRALRGGNRVKVLSYELGPIVDATLSGSGKALSGATPGC